MGGTPTGGQPPPRRRLRHRIPVSLRQHWKLLAVFVAFVTILATVFGATRIRPYLTGDPTIIASEITDNITGTVDLFDASVPHELSVEITDAEYDEMITAFQSTGEKKWVTADVTLDGTLITDVSVRLKGNSTLMGLRGTDTRVGGQGVAPPAGLELPEGFEPPATGGMSQATADDPTSLPLLVSFDENADGRAYQGMTEISVRPGSPVLNEAMALSLTAETEQPTQRYAYTVYSVNGSATTTRLLLEHPDDTYANSLFDSEGYLYKADASSRFEYVGDDQSDYADQFEQINAVGTGNLQPIVRFLEWLDSAGDEEFDAHLSEWVDVDSFARYVATQNLLVNGDDMSGPGQNYYLWYDLGTGRLSVVSWDLNLAMQGDATTGPHDTVSMGPGARGGAGQDGRGTPPAGVGAVAQPRAMPSDAAAPPGDGRMQSGNALKTRFLGSDAFTGVYEDAYRELYDQMYGSGRALEILDTLVATVPVSDGLPADSLRSSADSMRSWIEQRTAALAELRDS